ncbi:MAG: diguanylate cyclase, partial [Chloroflexota bacterium]|nr:diguanylate cyclase [Chloroflexota bacterium]
MLPAGSLEQDLLYDAIGASAVVAILTGVWLHRPDRRAPWLLLGVGQASFVIGDLLFVYFDHTGERPFPSLADAFYLVAYPILAAGLFLFIRRRLGGGDRSGLLDAAILTTSAGVLTWTFLMEPALVDQALDPLTLAISGAYPVADLILIGVTLGLMATPGARTMSFRLLVVSLGLMLLGDQAYALQSLSDAYQSGTPLDLLWLLSYLTIGLAALHPSMLTLSQAQPVAVTWLGPIRLIFMSAAMLTGPLLMTVGRPGADHGLWVIAGGSALLSMLVLARLAGLVRTLARDVEQRRGLEQRLSHQAFHDPLTGLANRRLFVDRVEMALATRKAPGSLAVMFLDVDDFKTVNDGFGHAGGDDFLVAVADRLSGAAREIDLAARLGGDEFGVLITGLSDASEARAIADRIHGLLS